MTDAEIQARVDDLMVALAQAKYSDAEIIDQRRDVFAAIRDAVDAATRRQWRPIEDAPKDGKDIIIGEWNGGNWYWGKGYWSKYLSRWSRDGGFAATPTHFMPLPTPPAPEARP